MDETAPKGLLHQAHKGGTLALGRALLQSQP